MVEPTSPVALYEDARLLAVDKPAGIATHSPERGLVWGMQEYLEWIRAAPGSLKIVHRLDRDTSGILLLAKTRESAAELTRLWESGRAEKTYLFITRRKPPRERWECRNPIEGKLAVTDFRVLGENGGAWQIEAAARTGRTHQVRIHAAESKVPVVGDREYASAADPWPMLLHASRLQIPGMPAIESAPPAYFAAKSPQEAHWFRAGALREKLFAAGEAVRWVHGAADGFPGRVVERYGESWLLVEQEGDTDAWLRSRIGSLGGTIKKHLGAGRVQRESPAAPPLVAVENGLRYEIRLEESTTTGLFLDQRENRLWLRRFLERGPQGPVLNCFAHTCAFSVAAASAGRLTVSVDLSPAYLEWGKHNFTLNGISHEGHRWLKGEARGWLRRLAKSGEKFAAVILDPPSFSRSKEGDFKADRDLPRLVADAAGVLAPGGALLAATNLRKWSPAAFRSKIQAAVKGRKFAIAQLPLPPDFPHLPGEPLWMKSLWLIVG